MNAVRRPLRTARKRLARWRQIGWRDRALVAEAAVALAVARVRLRLQPFRRIAVGMGTMVPPDDPRARARVDARDADAAAIARKVGWAVTCAARNVPFRAVCLPQAMAAHAMLRRRRIACAVHFGAMTGGARAIDAHAWLETAGVEVTGYPMDPNMTKLGTFV